MVANKSISFRYPQILTLCLAFLCLAASGSSISKRFSKVQAHFPREFPSLKESMNFTFNINASTEANVTANANAFLIGLQADKLLSANASECVNSALEFYYHEIPTYQVKLYYGSFDEKLFNTTAMLKNLTFDLMVCTDFVHDTVNYTQSQIQMFTSPAAYGLATF